MKEWGVYQQANATVVEKSIEFADRVWKPNRKLAYVVASLCHPLPVLNSKKRGFTAATLANSFSSAVMQMFDFEHALEFYGAEKDAICGAIAAAEFPKKKDAIERAEAGEKVPMKILFALWRKAAGVEDALEEMASEENPWQVSMECEWPTADSALWDGKTFHEWNECSSEMKEIVKPHTVEKWNGKDMALIMGGKDGTVLFTGGALTKWPADKNADVTQVAASAAADRSSKLITFGWRSQDDWRQAVASDRTVKPVTDAKASIIIGKTQPAEDGHTHDITMNLQILPANGHMHWFTPVNFDPAKGVLEGLTSSGGYYNDASRWVEHVHLVELGGSSKSESASIVVHPPKVEAEDFKSHRAV